MSRTDKTGPYSSQEVGIVMGLITGPEGEDSEHVS
jgi:hypothetical protein